MGRLQVLFKPSYNSQTAKQAYYKRNKHLLKRLFVKLQLNKQTSANLRKSQLKHQSLYRYTSANNYVSQYYY